MIRKVYNFIINKCWFTFMGCCDLYGLASMHRVVLVNVKCKDILM